MALQTFKIDSNKVVEDNKSRKTDKIFKNLYKSKKFKNTKSKTQICIKAIKKFIFLIFNIKKAFN